MIFIIITKIIFNDVRSIQIFKIKRILKQLFLEYLFFWSTYFLYYKCNKNYFQRNQKVQHQLVYAFLLKSALFSVSLFRSRYSFITKGDTYFRKNYYYPLFFNLCCLQGADDSIVNILSL